MYMSVPCKHTSAMQQGKSWNALENIFYAYVYLYIYSNNFRMY